MNALIWIDTLALTLALGLVGCGRGGSDSSASEASSGRPDEKPFALDWAVQKRLAACPPGTTTRSSEDGRARWCARPDGTRHGPETYLLGCLGIVDVRTPFADGVEDGESIAWYTGWASADGLSPSGLFVCDLLRNHTAPPGRLMRVRRFVTPYRKGKRHGLSTGWASNGRKVEEGTYAAGLKHGVWRQWSRSGKHLGSYEIKHGTGVERWWHDDGSPWRIVGWRNGAYHGRSARWNDAGVQVSEGQFHSGLPDGTWTQWNDAGVRLGSYRMQRGTGTIRHWHANGQLQLESSMEKGRVVRTRGWSVDGTRTLESAVHGDTEVLRLFNGDGALTTQMTLVGDKRHGPETHYDGGGNVVEIRHYERGKLTSTTRRDAARRRGR